MVRSCNFQAVVKPRDAAAALDLSRCEICSISEQELRERGQSLEVCGVEHVSDLATGENVQIAIPLCPDCHAKHHLDSRQSHQPCQNAARRSWERLI